MDYNYIISGAGAAGLSLLMRFIKEPAFKEKKILVVDKAPKVTNDRTWCFWEKEPGLFEPVVHHRWEQVYFHSNEYSELLKLNPYQYKMIRGIDFYNYVGQQALGCSNISFRYGNVEAVENEGDNGIVVIDGEKINAEYVFNSIIFAPLSAPEGKHLLLQHFKGLLVEGQANALNAAAATLMDFRINQQHGTSFVYVLPLSGNRTLVEYTLFTKELLQPMEYDVVLHNYINTSLGLKNYRVVEDEFGVIPMTNVKFKRSIGRVINIGTAGGQTKASSGYTFQFIQKDSERIIAALIKGKDPTDDATTLEKRFKVYDTILLNVLVTDKYAADAIFARMFRNNPIDRVLRFLDNESSVEDDLKLIATLPKWPFMKAVVEEITK